MHDRGLCFGEIMRVHSAFALHYKGSYKYVLEELY